MANHCCTSETNINFYANCNWKIRKVIKKKKMENFGGTFHNSNFQYEMSFLIGLQIASTHALGWYHMKINNSNFYFYILKYFANSQKLFTVFSNI